MFALLLLLFIAVPLVEIYVIIQVGQAIGALWTIAILIADSIIGSVLMRSQGRAVWRRFNATIAQGRPPAREVADGALVIFGGALLLTPGFTTDIAGLLCLLPPTRALIRRWLLRAVGRRLVVATPLGRFGGGPAGPAPGGPARRRRGPAPGDVEGTAHEVDPDGGRLAP